jgi:cysteine desulfurase
MSLSSHKIGGPIGIGCLLHRGDRILKPLVWGGGQERGWRSGTQAAPLAWGFACALKESQKQESILHQKMCASAHIQWEHQCEQEFNIQIILRNAPRVGVSCMMAKKIPQEEQIMALNHLGIAIGGGSACSSGKNKVSETLLSLGYASIAPYTLRLSSGWNTTIEDITQVFQTWISYIKRYDFI